MWINFWRRAGFVGTSTSKWDLRLLSSIFPTLFLSPSSSSSNGTATSLHKQPYCLCVGRLEKIKGFQTLIPLFRKHPDLVLAIAGTGTYESELRRLAGESPNIHFLGRQSGQALHALYQHALAVLVPSICFEIFGLVIIEAFQHHTPIIVRDLGGMPEMIDNSGGGYMYETDDQLLKALAALVNNPVHRHELGERGHQAYLRNWTVEVHLKRYYKLIQNIATKKYHGSNAVSAFGKGISNK